jgi:hypothetical protein
MAQLPPDSHFASASHTVSPSWVTTRGAGAATGFGVATVTMVASIGTDAGPWASIRTTDSLPAPVAALVAVRPDRTPSRSAVAAARE